MKRKSFELVAEMNGKLIADAAFVKFGQEAIKLIIKPAEGQIPKELLPLVNSPFGKLLAALGINYAADVYGIPGLDSVARAVMAASTTECANSLMDIAEKCLTRENEVLAKAKDVTPAPAQNVSKGNAKVSSPSGFLAVEKKAQEIKANTTQGSENVVNEELTEQGGDNDAPYFPVKKDELLLDEKNLCICPNPIPGKEPHSRQRDKFRPWVSKNMNGYRDDLEGMLMCGGCHNDMSVLYGKEKAKLDEEKKLAEAQTKIDTLTEEFDALNDKIVKAQGTEATYIKMLKEDPSNEDFAESLKSVQEKIKKMQEQASGIEKQVEELDKFLDSKTDGNKATPEAEAPAQNTTKAGPPNVQANAKVPTGAAARIKGKHGKGK